MFWQGAQIGCLKKLSTEADGFEEQVSCTHHSGECNLLLPDIGTQTKMHSFNAGLTICSSVQPSKWLSL